MVPEHLKARDIRKRFKYAILAASLKKKIERLREEESDSEEDMKDAQQALGADPKPMSSNIFREVVLAKIKDEKQKQEALEVEQRLGKDGGGDPSNSGT